MSITVCNFPNKIVFGAGSLNELTSFLPEGKKHLLLVLGKTAAETESVKKVIDSLQRYSPVIHIGVPAEPPLSAVDEIIELGRSSGCDMVAAIGGGSVIDAAKAAAALIPLNGSVADYFSGEKNITGKGLFFAACPTTAGTGAESTNNAVLTDPATKIKKSLRHATMKADLAIVDPLLTLSCPKALTAASGLDAFVQAFEAYANPKASVVSKAFSAEAASLILKNLKTACNEPENIQARTAMAEGSMLSGLGFSQTGLGAVHGIAHPVGSLLHVPHGMACAILMVPIMRFNAPVCGNIYAELAQRCGVGSTAEDFIRTAEKLARETGVPETFAEWGLASEHYDFIVKNCRSASMKTNPREMTDGDVIEVLKKLS